MSEQLKEQILYNSSEFSLKNLFWVDRYVSGAEGPTGTYESRRIPFDLFLQMIEDNIDIPTGVKIFHNNTGGVIEKGTICVIDGVGSGIISIAEFDRTQINVSQLYVAIEDINSGVSGNFIQEGPVTGIDTSGFAIGDVLFYENGIYSITRNDNSIFAGVVLASNVNGTIYYSPTQDYSVVRGQAGEVALFVGTDQIKSNSRFTFVDVPGVEVGYRIQDTLNNLLQVGLGYINMETEGTAQNGVIRMANWSSSFTNAISFRKSRGTKASPSGVLANDVLGQILGAGQHNSDGGTTTFEAKIVASEDYEVDLVSGYPEVYRYALTELQLFIASSIDTTIFNPPFPNPFVFGIDGNGRLRLKNFAFPSNDGLSGQTFITNGLGQLSWGSPIADIAKSMQTLGRNSTGSTLRKGTIVYISGSTGNRPNFVKAQANAESTSAGTFGVVVSDIPNNSDGFVCTIGTLENLDTRTTAPFPFTTNTLVDGDTLYLSPTIAGYVTNVKPVAPNHMVYVGKVVRTSPTDGTIVYRIQNGYELDELHDVLIQNPQDGEVLQREAGLWKNKPLPSAGVTGTGGTNRLAFWSSTTSIDDASWLYDDTSKDLYLLLGTLTEVFLGIYGAYFSHTRNVGAGVRGFQGFNYHLFTDSINNYPFLKLSKAYGDEDTPLYNPIGSIIGALEFEGGKSVNGKNASIEIVATENHSATNKGVRMIFRITKNGEASESIALTLDSDGRIIVSGAYKLPLTDGTAGQVMQTDGLGNISWVNGSSASGRGFSPMPISMCDTAPTAATTQYYYQTVAEQSMTLSKMKIYGYSGSDLVRVGIYRGSLETGCTLIGQGSATCGLGSNEIHLTAESGQNLNVTAGEDLVVGFYANGTSFRTIYRAGISDLNFAISNTADITTMPTTPTGTGTTVRFACTLY